MRDEMIKGVWCGRQNMAGKRKMYAKLLILFPRTYFHAESRSHAPCCLRKGFLQSFPSGSLLEAQVSKLWPFTCTVFHVYKIFIRPKSY